MKTLAADRTQKTTEKQRTAQELRNSMQFSAAREVQNSYSSPFCRFQNGRYQPEPFNGKAVVSYGDVITNPLATVLLHAWTSNNCYECMFLLDEILTKGKYTKAYNDKHNQPYNHVDT